MRSHLHLSVAIAELTTTTPLPRTACFLLGYTYSEYRYSAVDKSLISRYILRHYWTFAAEYLPPWLAPNAVTLIGFSAVVVNFITVAAVSPGLEGSEHGWVWALCAVGLFFYQASSPPLLPFLTRNAYLQTQTMDVLDGKQARKTGTSSPMGELFDHGCDALNSMLSSS